MKKKILLLFVILAMMLGVLMHNNVFATTNTLENIAEKFNNSELVAAYGAIFECEYAAEVDENVLTILISTGEMGDAVDFVLDGSVLTCENLTDETVFVAAFVADCIGQINGEYEDGELFQNFILFEDDVINYTVENEGFEIIEGEETYTAKMDIDKTVPLIDLSEYYLKPEEFDIIESIIEEDNVGNQCGRNARLAYDVSIGVEEDTIWIGEVDEITESTYKSILSALEVMYGEKVVEWFQETYPDFSLGSCMYNGFSIDVDEEIDFDEHPMFDGTHVVILTINKQYIKYRFFRTEYIGETIDKGNKQISLDFVKDKSYELGYFDLVSSSDIAFFFKYILSPAASTLEETPEDKTVYFNVVNDKFVLGDKDNSIIKVVLGDTSLTILPSKTNTEQTTVIAKYEDLKVPEYKNYEEIENINDFSEEIYRYLKYNVTVNVVYGNEKTDYEILEGANQTVNLSKNEGITFRFNIDYSKFLAEGKVYVDGKLVDSLYYTATEGSTIITLKEDYIKNLTVGEHTLKVAIADGEVSTAFTIEKEVNNPKTGDNIVIWISLMIVSVISLVGIVILRNKKKENK